VYSRIELRRSRLPRHDCRFAYWRPKAQTVVVVAEALWIAYRRRLRFYNRSTCMGQWLDVGGAMGLDVLRFKELWSLEAVEYSK